MVPSRLQIPSQHLARKPLYHAWRKKRRTSNAGVPTKQGPLMPTANAKTRAKEKQWAITQKHSNAIIEMLEKDNHKELCNEKVLMNTMIGTAGIDTVRAKSQGTAEVNISGGNEMARLNCIQHVYKVAHNLGCCSHLNVQKLSLWWLSQCDVHEGWLRCKEWEHCCSSWKGSGGLALWDWMPTLVNELSLPWEGRKCWIFGMQDLITLTVAR